MAEDKVEPRETNWRQLLPWTVLFQGFRVALDPNKLLLAAAGILLMAFGWWLLAIIFNYEKPAASKYLGNFNDYAGENDAQKRESAWKAFSEDRQKWAVMFSATGDPDPANKDAPYDAGDLADSPKEYDDLTEALTAKDIAPPTGLVFPHTGRYPLVLTQREMQRFLASFPESDRFKAKVWVIHEHVQRPAGAMRTWPWKEARGPNPYLLITNQTSATWEKGQFWDWLFREQIPVLVEPLVKFLSPIVYFFNPKAGALVRFYSLLVMLWTLVVWAFFGGAISRIAVVQVARQEKIGLMEAMRFAARKYLSYLSAPLFPLVLVAILLVLMVIFGYVQMIPGVGDIVIDGLLWGLMILLGLAMAVVLVGLVGWPLMSATISAEGTDAWEAVSRSYSYIYQAPWHYIFYSVIAMAYGAVIVFFVVLMASLTVYLAKWGVQETPGINWKDRSPTYLFVYAPTSFEWRTLLLQDDTHNLVSKAGTINEPDYDRYVSSMTWYNTVGAVLVSIVWVGIIFMLMLGFAYSYFWSSTSIIYLLMRRKVDDAELDEVYLEEEDEGAYAGPLAPKPAAPPVPGTEAGVRPSLPIVEAPARPPAAPAPPPAPPPPPPAAREDVAGAIHLPPPTPPAGEAPPPGPNKNPPGGV
jgi:hypothetical protein